MWYVDYGEGVTQEHADQEEAESAADAVAQPKTLGRTENTVRA